MAEIHGVEGTYQEDHWSLPCRRVLVVDADPARGAALALVLETLDQDVRCEHDGALAVRAAVALKPHLVLLDLELPTLTAQEVARRLRILRVTRHARVLACAPDAPGRHGAPPSGFDGWLPREPSLARLMAELRAAPGDPAVAPVAERSAPLGPTPPPPGPDSDFFSCTIRD